VIEAVLHIDLRGRLSRLVELELMDAPAHEIARRVAQCAQRELTDHCGCSNGTGLPVPVTTGITNNAGALALV
jgi:hypothetical protein